MCTILVLLLHEKQKFHQTNPDNDKLIIIAPSYGKYNLLEVCGLELLEILLKSDFRVLLRPHFRTLRDSKKIIKTVKEKFGNNPNFILEEGIIPPEKFHNSKCMISDWSGVSFEYAFTFERPVIFIDLPKKINNPKYKEIDVVPLEVSIREDIGVIVSMDDLCNKKSL